MSPRTARNEEPHRAHGAPGVLFAVVAVILIASYPLAVREALRHVGGGDGALAVLFKLPPIVVNGALALIFASTLRAGREPAITRFARLERGVLDPAIVAYTRRLTIVWAALFIIMAAVCIALSGPGTATAWQWWTSGGTWACVAGLFVGERIYRKRRFPQHAHASLLQQVTIVVRHWRK